MNNSVPVTCSRRLCFSAGHRVYGHEGGCRHPHGHNYVVTLNAAAHDLDSVGRVIDFSVLKAVVGSWIDEQWDHSFIFWADDREMKQVYHEHEHWKHFILPDNPTAENLAKYLLTTANKLLLASGVTVESVRVDETENCSAECHLPRQ